MLSKEASISFFGKKNPTGVGLSSWASTHLMDFVITVTLRSFRSLAHPVDRFLKMESTTSFTIRGRLGEPTSRSRVSTFPRFILQGRLRYLMLFLHHDMSDL